MYSILLSLFSYHREIIQSHLTDYLGSASLRYCVFWGVWAPLWLRV